VHLNSVIPRYIWKNISRTKGIFPDLQIVLITNYPENIEKSKHLGVSTELYAPDGDLLELLDNHAFDAKFRKGFWQTSIIRLFAFLEYAEKLNQTAVHVESDVLLSPSFPWQSFTKLEKLGWLKFNSDRDVAALVTCPNKREAIWVSTELRRLLRKYDDKTDMTLLSSISSRFPERIALLPIAHSSDSKLFNCETPLKVRVANSVLSSEFGGFFDAAPIGMWLNGQDPRNNFGILRRHLNLVDSFVNTRNLKIKTRKGRLFYHENDQISELFNLHLHSKIESDFGQTWRLKLIINSLLSNFETQIITFAPRKFMEVFGDLKNRHGSNPYKLFQLLLMKIRQSKRVN